ncbi:MAG: 4a-hydroxytetrahydrobiopterin dehydratase [Hyphomicrobium sp.]
MRLRPFQDRCPVAHQQTIEIECEQSAQALLQARGIVHFFFGQQRTTTRRVAYGNITHEEAPARRPVFGWGFATIVLQTKKIKGLHENDFIMAAKINDIYRAVLGEAEN